MGPTAELPLATGAVRIGEFTDPVVVDPDPRLLDEVLSALVDVSPSTFDPDLDDLRSAAESATDPWSAVDSHPTIAVLARRDVFETVTAGFEAASRLAGLVESGLLEPSVLDASQPNAVVAGRADGFAVVDTPAGWHAVGSDRSLRRRYETTLEEAEPFRPAAPSRHRLYRSFHDRCGRAVADDVVRALDVPPDPRSDVVDARVRAYLVGARHERLDRTVRRSCEEGGLGSPSTFTAVKRRLVDAGVVGTERVGQPVGRPRKRLIAREPFGETSLSDAIVMTRGAMTRDAMTRDATPQDATPQDAIGEND